ncbi:MAG: histidine kinase [Clostridia bacterium]|nr:histidine kinase [Clostridia bacterium]
MKTFGREIQKHTVLFGGIVIAYAFLILLMFWTHMRSYSDYMDSYRTTNQLETAYSESRTYFHLYNKERNPTALEQYQASESEVRRILRAIEPDIAPDGSGRMMVRVVTQMLDHREEVIDSYVSPGRGRSNWNIDYIEELDLLLQNNLDLFTNAYLDEISAFYAYQAGQMRIRLVLLTLSLLVGSFFVLWLNTRMFRRVSSSIGKLTEATIQVRNKHFDAPDIEPDEYEEINLVVQAFNDMKRTIREMLAEISRNFEIRERLTEQTLENERQKRYLAESKMKELQMQINPHFLFNTLSLVMRSIQLDEKETSITLIQSISRILRSCIETNSLAIPLDEEIELLESYLLIQRIHCRGRITLHLDVRKSYTESNGIYLFQQ